uniref:Aquaporin TIP5-1 n=1 Tax=Glycine max TaxID=3847 RepID=K7LSE4_SOYBN
MTGKLMADASLNPTSLVVVGIASAFALSSVLYIAWDISGGNVNPAVTFAMAAVGGHVAQLRASVMACLVLRVIVVGMVLEGILTFVLVYRVYAARDPRHGPMSSTGILVVGLMAGASVLATAPFSGGSMNPACAFGSAAIAGSFRNQAVYWVGPLIGATIAGLLYDNVLFRSQPTDSIQGIGV